jgi:hypothetical protein
VLGVAFHGGHTYLRSPQTVVTLTYLYTLLYDVDLHAVCTLAHLLTVYKFRYRPHQPKQSCKHIAADECIRPKHIKPQKMVVKEQKMAHSGLLHLLRCCTGLDELEVLVHNVASTNTHTSTAVALRHALLCYTVCSEFLKCMPPSQYQLFACCCYRIGGMASQENLPLHVSQLPQLSNRG